MTQPEIGTIRGWVFCTLKEVRWRQMRDVVRLIISLPGFRKRFGVFVAAVVLAQGFAIQVMPFVEREMITLVEGGVAGAELVERFGLLAAISAFATGVYVVLVRASFFNAAILRDEVWHGVFNAGFEKLIYHDLAYLARDRSSGLLNKVTRAAYKLADLFTESAAAFFRNMTRAIVSLAILYALSWQVALGVTATLVMYTAIYFWRFREDKPLSKERDELEEGDFARVYEVVPQAKLVKILTNEEREIGELRKLQDRFVENTKKKEKLWNIAGFAEIPLVAIPTIALVFFAAWQAASGLYGIPTLVLILTMIRSVQDPMWIVNWFMWEMQFTYDRAKKFQQILASQEKVVDPVSPVPLHNPGGDIVFDKVSFKYKESDGQVLTKFNAVFRGGRVSALVGRSGAGKTTITNMIARFFDPDRGKVTIGGVDVRKVKIRELRGEIGFVLQESFVFSGTVAENLRYAREDASDYQLRAALKKAQAWEFVKSLPKGIKTEIGERGVKLSGGQRQRLAIARMILENPRIVILDEATNALDSESEQAVQAALKAFLRGRTVVVVAHRLSTVQHADRIFVVDGGRVLEEGTHRELVEQGGIYSMLWEIQAGGFERQREIMEEYEL